MTTRNGDGDGEGPRWSTVSPAAPLQGRLHAALEGATLCLRRIRDAEAAAPPRSRDRPSLGKNLTRYGPAWTIEHDLGYYANEVLRVLDVASKLRWNEDVRTALEAVETAAPKLRDFRASATDAETGRDVAWFLHIGSDMRGEPAFTPNYVLSLDHIQPALERLVAVADRVLEVNRSADPPDSG